MSHKSEYTIGAQELIQEVIRLRALEKQFTKERGELMARVRELEMADELNVSVAESHWKMRAEVAEVRNRELMERNAALQKHVEATQSDLAARDALIGELREGLAELKQAMHDYEMEVAGEVDSVPSKHRLMMERANALLARTPADAARNGGDSKANSAPL